MCVFFIIILLIPFPVDEYFYSSGDEREDYCAGDEHERQGDGGI